MHLPAWTAPRLRVAPKLRAVPRQRRLCRLPRIASPWAVPKGCAQSLLGVLITSARSELAGHRVAPRPARSAAPPIWSCGLPRLPRRFGFAGDGVASFPAPSSFRRCRLTGLRVAPFRPFGIADDPPSDCSASQIFRLRMVRILGHPRARLPGLPVVRSPGLPGSLPAGLAFGGTCGPLRIFRSAGGADRPISKLP